MKRFLRPLLRAGLSLPGLCLLSAALAWAPAARAAPPLKGLPEAFEDRGNAFVDAWSILIRDLDVIPASQVHPALVDAWFESMPGFLARDVLRAGNSPAVLVSAAWRLAALKGGVSATLIAKTARKSHGDIVREALMAAALRAGDDGVKREVEEDFQSANSIRKIFAARVLAAAGVSKGIAALWEISNSKGPGATAAVRALGRLGGPDQRSRLAELSSRSGSGSPAWLALCEWKVRMSLPDVYRVLELRDMSGARQTVIGGMYDTWYAILAELLEAHPARRKPLALAAAIDDVKLSRSLEVALDLEPEVLRRRGAALQKVLESVSARKTATSARPHWPGTFEQARAQLGDRAGSDSPEAFASRVTAAIALTSRLGEELGYSSLDGPDDRLMGLSPGAGRVLDGDFDTAWHGVYGEQLTLTTSRPVWVDGVKIAVGCPDGARVDVTGVVLEARDHRGEILWTLAARVNPDQRYYQTVDLGSRRRLERFSVRLKGRSGPVPACLRELRLTLPRE